LKIFCTVENPEKIENLVENFGIPKRYIFNSRNDPFAADIVGATDYRVVDLVLNSLAGELLHSSWKCVAKLSTITMIEIYKWDLRRHARLVMDVFKLNSTFIGLDLGLVHQQQLHCAGNKSEPSYAFWDKFRCPRLRWACYDGFD
jgi:NADPH:quinone reductase-like Zn-dependent oxidoreductase